MKVLLPIALLFALCGYASANNAGDPIKSIYWSDGDSGRITKLDGQIIKFRLDDWDAPETGGIGAAIGPAQCELERKRGYASKAFMVQKTQTDVTYTHNNETDDIPSRHALLVKLYVRQKDIANEASELGHLKRWLHNGSKALEAKPLWCD